MLSAESKAAVANVSMQLQRIESKILVRPDGKSPLQLISVAGMQPASWQGNWLSVLLLNETLWTCWIAGMHCLQKGTSGRSTRRA